MIYDREKTYNNLVKDIKIVIAKNMPHNTEAVDDYYKDVASVCGDQCAHALAGLSARNDWEFEFESSFLEDFCGLFTQDYFKHKAKLIKTIESIFGKTKS